MDRLAVTTIVSFSDSIAVRALVIQFGVAGTLDSSALSVIHLTIIERSVFSGVLLIVIDHSRPRSRGLCARKGKGYGMAGRDFG